MIRASSRSRREFLRLIAAAGGYTALSALLSGCSSEESVMIPEIFRDLDRTIAQKFSFLVDDKGCNAPTVEYWRDYFLVYSLPELRCRIGMERDCVVPFIFIDYHKNRLVVFHLPRLLDAMGIPLDSSDFPNSARLAESFSTAEYRKLESTLTLEWPKHLSECARVLDQHFEDIIARVRSASLEDSAQGIGHIIPEGIPVIGAGSYFLHKRFLPIGREDFWKIIDHGFAPSYAPGTCSRCAETGNVGVRRRRPTSFLERFRRRPVELYCPRCEQISLEE